MGTHHRAVEQHLLSVRVSGHMPVSVRPHAKLAPAGEALEEAVCASLVLAPEHQNASVNLANTKRPGMKEGLAGSVS